MLTLFSDRQFLPGGLKHALPLLPFWGEYIEHDGYARFGSWARAHWRLSATGEDADVAAFPFDGRELLETPTRRPDPSLRALAQRFVNVAADTGLHTLIVVNDDSCRPLPLSGPTIVLRTSLDRTTRRPHEFALPAWHEDIVDTHLGGHLPLRDYNSKPCVSFCGIAAKGGPPLKRRAKLLAFRALKALGYRVPHNDGVHLRHRAMSLLNASRRVDTSFIVRDAYFGGSVTEPTLKSRVRTEYIQNILDSDYVLCVRGWGNFSFRFFEAMSLGRTPVLIDTDCVLPFDFIRDYGHLCLIVPEDAIGDLDRLVSEFHARFDPESYRAHQRRVRSFWVEWLSAAGFFRHVAAHWDLAARADHLAAMSSIMAT